MSAIGLIRVCVISFGALVEITVVLLYLQLPQMAKGLGKRYFKMHLESFFDIIFFSVVSIFVDTAAGRTPDINMTFLV